MATLAVIFSKDRAAQLDLLLRSMKKHCPGSFKTVVLFTHSNYNHKNGYDKVTRRHRNNYYEKDVQFVKEENFKQDFLQILGEHLPTPTNNSTRSRCVGLFTDDSVFYRDFSINDEEMAEFLIYNSVMSFSTRLGSNILYQNHWETTPVTPVRKTPFQFNNGSKGFIWRVSEASHGEDFGRPISMDGNIHYLEDYVELLESNKWECVRTLDAIQPRDSNVLSSAFDESVLVNIPANLVYNGKADNYGKYHGYSQDELNNWWLQGNYVDLDNLVSGRVVSSHQEFDLLSQGKKRTRIFDGGVGGIGLSKLTVEEKEDIENWLPSEDVAKAIRGKRLNDIICDEFIEIEPDENTIQDDTTPEE